MNVVYNITSIDKRGFMISSKIGAIGLSYHLIDNITNGDQSIILYPLCMVGLRDEQNHHMIDFF